MDELAAARAERLGTIREIIESCSAVGDKVDVDIITQVLQEALACRGPEPEQPRPLNDEEQRAYCGLSTTLAALRNLSWYMAQGMKPGRQRRQLDELPERIGKLVEQKLLPRMETMPEIQVIDVLAEATRWAFVIWSPAEQLAMFEILDAVAAGGDVPTATREQARAFAERYRKSMPMGGLKKEVHHDAAGAD